MKSSFVAHHPPTGQRIRYTWTITALFMADILMTLNTAIFVDAEFTTDRKQICYAYFSSRQPLIDFMSASLLVFAHCSCQWTSGIGFDR